MIQAEVKKATKFDEGWYARVYEFARDGLKVSNVVDLLGTSQHLLRKAFTDYPHLVKAYEMGRAKFTGGSTAKKAEPQTFLDYVYARLPSELRQTWDELEAAEKSPCAEKLLEGLLADKGVRVRQRLLIHALVACNFNMSEACKRTLVSHFLLNSWSRTDPDFAAILQEIQWHRKNFCEGALLGLVRQGDPAAIIFANKTINRDRGYDPKVEVEVSMADMNPNEVDVSQLDLSIECRREILEAIRKRDEARTQASRVLSLEVHKGGE